MRRPLTVSGRSRPSWMQKIPSGRMGGCPPCSFSAPASPSSMAAKSIGDANGLRAKMVHCGVGRCASKRACAWVCTSARAPCNCMWWRCVCVCTFAREYGWRRQNEPTAMGDLGRRRIGCGHGGNGREREALTCRTTEAGKAMCTSAWWPSLVVRRVW